MMAADQPGWYVAQTHPNSEGKAAIQLQRQGFETYLPRYIKTARHARRTRLLQAPLFPRYIFVRLDPQTQRWRAVNSTTGITQLVGHGDRPSPVVAGIIESLKQREGANGFFDFAAPAMSFKPGDAVCVVRGVFEACQGFFEARTDRDRVAILLDLLGRKVRVVLVARAVEAV